jgi:CRP/FNR family transcriptional regulator, cyclic AMP receptor protein
MSGESSHLPGTWPADSGETMASRDSGLPGGGGGRPQGPGVTAQPAAAGPRPAQSKTGSGPSPQPGSATPEVLRVLQGAALFKGFTDTGLQIVGSIAQQKHIPAGTPLFVENMIGDGLFIIADGMIRIAVRGPQGQDITLTVLGANESLGEAALLRAGPRLCTAIAEVPTTVIEITRRDIAALQRTKPQACLKLMMGVVDVIGAKMREAQNEYRQFVAWRLGIG